MAGGGILDFLNEGDNPLGLALLAAGGPTTDPNRSGFGQRIAGAVNNANQAVLQRDWRQSQIEENKQQAALRAVQMEEAKRKAAALAAFTQAEQAAASGGAGAGGGGGGLGSLPPSTMFGAAMNGIVNPQAVAIWQSQQPVMKEIAPGYWANEKNIKPGENVEAIRAREADELRKAEHQPVTFLNEKDEKVTMTRREAREAGYLPPLASTAAPAAPAPAAAGPGPVVAPRTLPGPPLGAAPVVPGMTGRAGPTNAAERGMAGNVADTLQTNEARLIEGLRRDLATPGAITHPDDRRNAERYLAQLEGQPQASVRAPAGPLIGPGAGRAAVPVEAPAAPVAAASAPASPAPLIARTPSPGLVTELSPARQTADAVEKERQLLAARAAAAETARPGQSAQELKDYEAKKKLDAAAKAAEVAPKKAAEQKAAMQQADVIIKKVDQALDKTGFFTTGLTGSVLGMVPGTSARDLEKTVTTIKANLGFAELQAMRNASPTGGALGSVAVKELEALQSTVANLDNDQSEAQLRKNLAEIRTRYGNWKKAVAQDAAAAGGDAPKPAGKGPAAGAVEGGYRFKGGNPADSINWEKV